eukprot:4809383-Heterocapsa_arctica.AAC.1
MPSQKLHKKSGLLTTMARNEAKRKRRPDWSQSSPEAVIPVLTDLIQKVNQPHRERQAFLLFNLGMGTARLAHH